MSRKLRSKSKLWEYLDAVGILEKGTEEQIRTAKRNYRKQYFLEHKRRLRLVKPEFQVSFSKEKGEYDRIVSGAKQHNAKITSFIRESALAYLTQSFVVPNKVQIYRLEQMLADCLNEVRTISKSKERLFWSRENKIEAIEKRIEKLEKEMREILTFPPFKTNPA